MEKYAIDLDGVVFDYIEPFLLYCKIQYNIDFSYNDMCVYNFVQKKFGPKAGEELIRNFNSNNKYLNLPIIKYAVETIKELSFIGDIYIMTSRSSKYRKETIYTLVELGIDFREVFIDKAIDKLSIIKSLGVSSLMEDNGALCGRAADEGVRAYCFEKPYNKIYISKNKKIIPVKNWIDVLASEIRIFRGGDN